jgi:SpoVK/Ycf46/Vps4 family AAA+-type ATPase
MERFRGVFVCTTNLMDRIDAAALRRFTFKLRFLPLKLEQRLTLFAREVLQTADVSTLDPDWTSRLRQLDQLCTGDFAAVRRQWDILGETPTPEDFLDQLEAEHRLKPEVRERRHMGFTG